LEGLALHENAMHTVSLPRWSNQQLSCRFERRCSLCVAAPGGCFMWVSHGVHGFHLWW